MNLHEYQAKNILASYGVSVPKALLVESLDQVGPAWHAFGGQPLVIKAQIHAGGRGKAGGVKVVHSVDEAETVAADLLGKTLVTYQTGPEGLPVSALLFEQTLEIGQELYLSALVDRATRKIVFMASAAGGMDIEQVAAETPEKILTTLVQPAAGLQGFQCREIAFGLGLQGAQIKQLTQLMMALYQLMLDKDAALIEINPLIITGEGDLLPLDCKIAIDDNAVFRHPTLQAMRDASQENARENAAKEWELNYIALDGEIGCMVNGAGLAMATMDLIQLCGGRPANFLDVGGGATAQRVAEAFKIILSDTQVKAVLVNIFGGIVRCDLIADGIIQAVKEVGVQVPVIVRLEGTNVELGREKLAHSGLGVIAATDLMQAAQTAVAEAYQ